MMDFMNKIKLSDQKYQTNGNVRDKNYKINFLFPMKYFKQFVKYSQSMYFMPTILLKDKTDGFRG